MLTELVPDEVVFSDLELSRDALELRDILAAHISIPGIPPLEVSAFIHRLLTIFCQNGSPTGLALRPPATHPRPQPGQIRQVPKEAWQPRRSIREPLFCALARRIVCLTAKARLESASWLSPALHILNQVSIILDKLSREERWAIILLTQPKGVDNRVFDLHFYTAGYPAWEHLALRLQAGLVAQIQKESEKPPAVRDQNIRSYCTAPKALVPLIRADLLVPALATMDEDETLLRDALWQAASQIKGISPNTRRDYVVKLLDMLHRGAASRPPSTGHSGFRRRRRRPFSLAELDPEAAPSDIPDAPRWQELVCQAAYDEDAPILEWEPEEFEEEQAEVEEEERAEDVAGQSQLYQRRPWYLGNRITMNCNVGPDHPGVFQLHEIAELYLAVLDVPISKDDLAARLNRATRFLMLDMLIHTGRPPKWIATITLGKPPSFDEPLSGPVYDFKRGAICYTPACYIGIPPRLLGIDEKAIRERQIQAEACEPVRLWHYLPLTPHQFNLISAYLKLRTQALAAFSLESGVQATGEEGPLLLLIKQGLLQPWTETDTEALFSDLTAALRRRHPGWPAVRPARFRLTFTAWYRYYGLDPVYALWISEHYRNELQMPAIYSRIRVGVLARAYAAAQKKLRTEVEGEYRALIRAASTTRPDPLLWQPDAPLEVPSWSDRDSFGSWHCSRRSRVRALFSGLAQMAASADQDAAHRGRVARIAAGLTVLTGLRPAEVCNLRARWVDIDDGTIAVHGKDNFALTADRQVPIPAALYKALKEALAVSAHGPLPEDGRGHYLLWLNLEGVPVALRESEINRILIEAGLRVGLREEQVPDWYALRHYWRSRALEEGIPFDAINALMGHQMLGCDLYNRALNQTLAAALMHGRALADIIAQEVGISDGAS